MSDNKYQRSININQKTQAKYIGHESIRAQFNIFKNSLITSLKKKIYLSIHIDII